MAQEYFSTSDLTTPSETDVDDSSSETGSELSSGGLTRANTLDSFEEITSSIIADDATMNRLSNLLGRTSIGEPRALDENNVADAADVETPVLKYTLEEAKAILEAQSDDSKKKRGGKQAYKKVNDVVSANAHLINTDRKGFGFKFISLCITAAFGGRRGMDRYDEELSHLNLKSIPKLSKCFNGGGGFNITVMCYIGHIILYYWSNQDVRRALINRFGPLDEVVGSKKNVRNEIGAKNLWAPEVQPVHSFIKKRIIGQIEEKFLLDETEFESIMLKMGIDLT